MNLSATCQVIDAKRVLKELADHNDFLCRELQLALRATYGLQLKTAGARDIILPGEMKSILTQVVEAEKKAEANLIKRRE